MLRQLPSAVLQKPCELGDIECRRQLSDSLNAGLTERFGKASDVTLKDHFIARPDGSELRDEINGAIADLHQDGTVRRIVDRWTD